MLQAGLDPINPIKVEEEAGAAISRGSTDEDENVSCRDNNNNNNNNNKHYTNTLNNQVQLHAFALRLACSIYLCSQVVSS